MTATPLVIYHADCQDGFGAAWAARRHFGDDAAYLPAQYGDEPPSVVPDADIYILDFSYPRPALEALAASRELPARVVVIDHHKTAREALSGLPDPDAEVLSTGPFARFDMDKSGAVLAWEYFHPGVPVPMLLRYVQDRDLWKWELPFSREFSARLALVPRNFGSWNLISAQLGGPEGNEELTGFAREGGMILAAQRAHIGSLASKAVTVDVGGHRVPAVNSPLFQSELGEELCKRYPEAPFAAVWFSPGPDTEVWSLRSRNGFDVSAVARELGGGGHPAAAGFKRVRN